MNKHTYDILKMGCAASVSSYSTIRGAMLNDVIMPNRSESILTPAYLQARCQLQQETCFEEVVCELLSQIVC